MRKKLKWSHRTGIPIDQAGEQLIALPLALCDHSGNPHKGQKSYMTKALVNRYKDPIVLNNFPPGWQPECCLLEGMFMITTSPVAGQTTFGDYGHFLMRRHEKTPKTFEQKRRDALATTDICHKCEEITESTKIALVVIILCALCVRLLAGSSMRSQSES